MHFFLMNASIHSTFVHLLLNIFIKLSKSLKSEKILHSSCCKIKGILHCTSAIWFPNSIEVDKHNRAIKLQFHLQNYCSAIQQCYKLS